MRQTTTHRRSAMLPNGTDPKTEHLILRQQSIDQAIPEAVCLLVEQHRQLVIDGIRQRRATLCNLGDFQIESFDTF